MGGKRDADKVKIGHLTCCASSQLAGRNLSINAATEDIATHRNKPIDVSNIDKRRVSFRLPFGRQSSGFVGDVIHLGEMIRPGDVFHPGDVFQPGDVFERRSEVRKLEAMLKGRDGEPRYLAANDVAEHDQLERNASIQPGWPFHCQFHGRARSELMGAGRQRTPAAYIRYAASSGTGRSTIKRAVLERQIHRKANS